MDSKWVLFKSIYSECSFGAWGMDDVMWSRDVHNFWADVWNDSFVPSYVYSIYLLRLSFCCSLSLKGNTQGLCCIFACNCDLALQKELVNACTALHTTEVGGEVVLVRCECGHRRSGVGRVLRCSLLLSDRKVRALPGNQNLLNRWIFPRLPNFILHKSGF